MLTLICFFFGHSWWYYCDCRHFELTHLRETLTWIAERSPGIKLSWANRQSPQSPDKYLKTCIQHSIQQMESKDFYLIFRVFYKFYCCFFLLNYFPVYTVYLMIVRTWSVATFCSLPYKYWFSHCFGYNDDILTKSLLLRQQFQLEATVNIYVSSDSPPTHKILCHYALAATSVCCLVLRV